MFDSAPLFDLRVYPVEPYSQKLIQEISYVNRIAGYSDFNPEEMKFYKHGGINKTLRYLDRFIESSPHAALIYNSLDARKGCRWRSDVVSPHVAAVVSLLIQHETQAHIWIYQLAVMALEKCATIKFHDLFDSRSPFGKGVPPSYAYVDAWIAQKIGNIDRLLFGSPWSQFTDATNVRGRDY